MSQSCQIGLYGKLPAYGDFVVRNLPREFVQVWDEWLRLYVSVGQEQIGSDWLDRYLTSPIWRFALSPGVVDEKNWAGIIMPSVDRVGRYFPFSILLPLAEKISPVYFISAHQQWYDDIESLSLQALEEEIDADDIIARAFELELAIAPAYSPTTHYGDTGSFITELAADNNNAIGIILPYLLDASLTSNWTSFSLWQTSGSDVVAPSLFCSQNLPAVGSLASMIDGQWQARNWKIPFNINA